MPMHSKPKHLVIFAFVALLHFVATVTLAGAMRQRAHKPSVDSSVALVTIYTTPRVRQTPAADHPDLSIRLVALQAPSLALHFDQPSVDSSTSANPSAVVGAPILQDDSVNERERLAREAGLTPGEGVTVVLRVEVLDTGVAGHVEVDTSSGRHQIDQAAIDYVRSRHWSAGRMARIAHTMWIRMGVRLQA